MLKKLPVFFIAVLAVFLLSAGCSKYQKLLKSTDYEQKYEAAVKYYEKKDFYKAQPLLEELTTIYRGTKKAEKTYYYYAYCHYELGEYELAGYHFDNFVRTFPNSELSEECMYMKAYCFYLESPVHSLDQTNTQKAISELQLFMNMFPKSQRISQCNELMDKLRLKLENKAYDNAILYYNMEDYKSAVVALKNVIKDFPDTKHKEECLFLIVKSNYLYAGNSIESKKSERYRAAIESYYFFVSAFPKSINLKSAQEIFDDSLKRIEKLKQSNS